MILIFDLDQNTSDLLQVCHPYINNTFDLRNKKEHVDRLRVPLVRTDEDWAAWRTLPSRVAIGKRRLQNFLVLHHQPCLHSGLVHKLDSRNLMYYLHLT